MPGQLDVVVPDLHNGEVAWGVGVDGGERDVGPTVEVVAMGVNLDLVHSGKFLPKPSALLLKRIQVYYYCVNLA